MIGCDARPAFPQALTAGQFHSGNRKRTPENGECGGLHSSTSARAQKHTYKRGKSQHRQFGIPFGLEVSARRWPAQVPHLGHGQFGEPGDHRPRTPASSGEHLRRNFPPYLCRLAQITRFTGVFPRTISRSHVGIQPGRPRPPQIRFPWGGERKCLFALDLTRT